MPAAWEDSCFKPRLHVQHVEAKCRKQQVERFFQLCQTLLGHRCRFSNEPNESSSSQQCSVCFPLRHVVGVDGPFTETPSVRFVVNLWYIIQHDGEYVRSALCGRTRPCSVRLKFHGSSFPRRILAKSSRGCPQQVARVGRVGEDFTTMLRGNCRRGI